LEPGHRLKVLQTSAPKMGEARRAQVADESGLQGWITIMSTNGTTFIATPAAFAKPSAVLEKIIVGSHLEALRLLPVRAGEALSSPYLSELLPHSRIKILELAPESPSPQRRALVATVVKEPNKDHVQGWVSLSSSTGALLVRLVKAEALPRLQSKSQALEGQDDSFTHSSNKRVMSVSKLLEYARSGDLERFKEIAEAQVPPHRDSDDMSSPTSPTRRPAHVIDRSDIRGRTPLMYAAAFGSVSVVEYLLNTGEVYVNALDDTQKTALHHAAKHSKVAEMKLLLRAGAMIDARDHNGCTALMFCAGTGDPDGVQALLDKGANPNTRDYQGNSTLSYAQDVNHTQVVEMLLAAGAEDVQEEEEDSVMRSRKKRVRTETVKQADLEEAAAVAVLDDELSEEEQRRNAAEARLKELLDGSTPVRDLEAALEEASQAKVDDELQDRARNRIEELKERDAAYDHLTTAIEEAKHGSRGPEGLQGLQEALQKAEAKGVDAKQIQHGKQVLDEEMPRAKARQQLREAQAKGANALRAAIAEATTANLPAAELAPFQALLQASESKEAAEAALKKAMESKNIASLTFSLQQAKEASVDAEVIAAAQAIWDVEAPKHEARERLAAQLSKVNNAGDQGPTLEDLTALEEAIEKARSAQLTESEFAAALDVLAQEQQRAMIKKEVAKVVAKWKDVDRNSMEALEEAKEELFNTLLAAKAVEVPSAALREADGLRRRLHNALEDLKGSIRVFCRIRPISQREKDLRDADVTELVDSMTVNAQKPSAGSFANEPEQFNFDAVFKPGTQAEVFDTCKDLVQSALDGYNVAMFAYGQTGAGKTYTMYGGSGEGQGTAPRTIAELYRLIKQDEDRVQFTVIASMMELYRNELVDLLASRAGGASPKRKSPHPNAAAVEQKLNVRVDKSGAVQIEHLQEEECKTAEALLDLLERGNQMRTVCATKMNSESSRSHLLLTIRVVGVNKQTDQKLHGKILLCDLAGSERLKKSDVSGEAQKEAIEINKSLTALGDVMEALVKGASHVPYKNHKLTQVMSDALGGTSKTLMFVNCSPASSNYEETVMTLKFATRAKTITNDVKRKMIAKAKPVPKA